MEYVFEYSNIVRFEQLSSQWNWLVLTDFTAGPQACLILGLWPVCINMS